jgi:CRISPR-associated protein Csx16
MTVEPEKVKRLVTFLGLGRFDRDRREYVYDPTTYALSERQAETTPFVCRALCQLFAPSEVVVLATERAESTHASALKEALRAGDFPSPEIVQIPMGENRTQLWEQFELIKAQLRESDGPVMLDITHGFRSQPFFAAAVASFVRAVDDDPPDLRVCYAAFDPKKDVTQIWDLSEFVALLDWASALMLFLRTGRAEPAATEAERIGREIRQAWFTAGRIGAEPRLKELGESLRQFGKDLETLRTGDLLIGRGGKVSSASRLLAAVTAASEDVVMHTPPLADVLGQVAQMIRPLANERSDLSGGDSRGAVAALAQMYLRFGRYLEATATVREGWINLYAGKPALVPGVDHFDKQERDRAEIRAGYHDPVFRQVQDRRNDLLHAQYRSQREAQDAGGMIRSVMDLVTKFAGVSGTCFINLTNHPSSHWEQEQTEEALALAERIEDVPFPNVPPEASERDLAAFAEACVTRVPTGATHALVQGEFTLAFEIVRRLQERGVTCLAATTDRHVEDSGEGRKTSTFRFVRFRAYSPMACSEPKGTASR